MRRAISSLVVAPFTPSGCSPGGSDGSDGSTSFGTVTTGETMASPTSSSPPSTTTAGGGEIVNHDKTTLGDVELPIPGDVAPVPPPVG